MNRRQLLIGGAAAALLAACGGGDDKEPPPSPATTKPGPGAGSTDDVLLRTGAALALAAAQVHERAGGDLGVLAAASHREHATQLDPAVTEPHDDALRAWVTPLDAELSIAATCQAWTAVLSSPSLRQRIMTVGGASSRLYTAVQAAATGTPSLPEAFQLVDPAIPDTWLIR